MHGKIDTQTEELARQYVLGALPSEQAREFETRLRADERLAALVHDIAQVSAAIAKSLVAQNAEARTGNAFNAAPEALPLYVPPEIESDPTIPSAPASIGWGRFSFMLNSGRQNWRTLPAPGCAVQELEVSDRYAVLLLHLRAGASYPAHRHLGAEETYVLSGEIHLAGQVLREGDFHHADPGSIHGESTGTNGCLLLLVTSPADHAHLWSGSAAARIIPPASSLDPSPR